jgi:hypothetical protein
MNKMRLEIPANSENGYHPFFIVMVILFFHVTIFFNNYESILHQITTRDFDGYWHLLRVENLYNSGNIYENTLSRSNAPYGEILHWTRAFDLLLYAGAYAGSFFVDFKVALFWWSIVVNPVLHVLSFLVLFWGLRDLIGDARASLFGILLPFQPHLYSIFNIGVPDHHGSIIFIFSLFIALVFKSILSGNWKTFSICGIAGGIAIWFSIESIAVVLIALSLFGLAWVLEGKSYQRKNFLFSFLLLATTLLTMFIDTRPDELMKIEYDRRSIVHVFLWVTTTVFWALIVLVSKYTNLLDKKIARIIAAIIGVAACILLMHELFPHFFKNPLAEVDPAIQLIYLNEMTEFTGLFSKPNNLFKSSIAYWTMTLPGVPIGIFLAWRSIAKERLTWIFITLINIVFIILSAMTFRMITYAILCTLIPISYAFYFPFAYITQNFGRPYNIIARAAFIVMCCYCFLLPNIAFDSDNKTSLLTNGKFLSQICHYLNEDPFFKKKPQRILTSIYWGPLLLYKTPHEVIGTPSHRNVSSILDTYYVMNALREDDAHMIIRRRGIQAILIGRPEDGIGDFFPHNIKNVQDSGEIFHHQLWKGNIPAWLQLYAVPKALEGKIKVFKVID